MAVGYQASKSNGAVIGKGDDWKQQHCSNIKELCSSIHCTLASTLSWNLLYQPGWVPTKGWDKILTLLNNIIYLLLCPMTSLQLNCIHAPYIVQYRETWWLRLRLLSRWLRRLELLRDIELTVGSAFSEILTFWCKTKHKVKTVLWSTNYESKNTPGIGRCKCNASMVVFIRNH